MTLLLLQILFLLSLLIAAPAADARRHHRHEPAMHHPPTFAGKASWYGPELHGRRTASGERFDMHKLTAAHRTLPFGTKLLVKNHRTGRSCVVTINDRGPHRSSRCIDVSREAARQLGIYPNGEGHISAHILGKHGLPIADTLPPRPSRQTHIATKSAPVRLPKPSMAVPAEVASAWQSL
jgi:rare lipoprotein A